MANTGALGYVPPSGLEYRSDGQWQSNTNWASGLTPVEYAAPSSIQSVTRPVIGGNASPLGRPIPTGLGMVVHTGDPVIDPRHLGGYRVFFDEDGNVSKVLVNLVFCILDTQLGDVDNPFQLIWARTNKQFIIRTATPVRTINSPYRFYGGDQTAVDPLITQYMEAQYRTAWPGFVYIVFENFDILPYDLRVPVFDFQIASDVTQEPAAEVQSTLTFGAFDEGYENYDFAIDRSRQLHFQIVQNNGDDAIISVIRVDTEAEISRAAVTAPTTFGWLEHAVGLDGSNFLVCTTWQPSTNYQQLSLINAFSGEIVASIAPLLNGPDPFEPYVKHTVYLSGSKYLALCGSWASGNFTASGLAVAVADIAAGTLAWIVHPYTMPAVGSANEEPFSLAVGPVTNGACTIFYTEGFPGVLHNVRKATISATALVSSGTLYTEADFSKDPIGVAFDYTDGKVAVYRQDGSFIKVDPAGNVTTLTGAQSPNNLTINVGNYTSNRGFHYLARPGFAYGIAAGAAGGNNIWEIDLSDGSMHEALDYLSYTAWDTYQYFDAYQGFMTEGAEAPGVINIIKLGDATPNTIDLADIMQALSTFDGRNDVSELAFTGFLGNECYGVKYESDTSIQDALQTLREPFDISIVESDGVLKFRWPPRDGAFVADLTLTDTDDFVDKGQFVFEKVQGAEQEALRACTISFYDRDNYGEPGATAEFARPKGAYDITHSIDRRSLNLPLYMTASRALQQAALVVYRSVYALENYNGSLGPALAHVEPGDIVTFPFRDFIVTAQVKSAQLNANYTQDISAVQYLQAHDATYTGAGVVVPPITSTPFEWTIPVAAGSYLITGSSAGLLNIPPPAMFGEPGSYAVSGTATSIRRGGAALAAATGSYVITGTAATLTYSAADIQIVAALGSYAITGSAASLRAAQKLAAAAGSYTIVGSAVTFTLQANKSLAATAGSYAVTGTDAALRYGRNLAAGVGSYALMGTDATLTKTTPYGGPTFVSVGALAASTGAVVPALPAGWAQDDIFLLAVMTANTAVSTPAGGWAAVTNSPQGTGTANNLASCRLTLFWKRATASESDPTVADSGDSQFACISAYRGCTTSGNPWDVTAGDVQSSDAATAVVNPSVTTTVANCLIVAICAHGINQTGSFFGSGFSNATVGNLQPLVFDAGNTAGNGGGLGIAVGEKATTGVTNTFTATLGTASTQGRLTVALKP